VFAPVGAGFIWMPFFRTIFVSRADYETVFVTTGFGILLVTIICVQ
jgi:hypothetical protein